MFAVTVATWRSVVTPRISCLTGGVVDWMTTATRAPAATIARKTSGRPLRAARREGHSGYWPVPFAAASAWAILAAISALMASRLKLAPRCIGG
jgi:hypothetical protein